MYPAIIPSNVPAKPEEKACDLDALGMLFEEFLTRHSRHSEDEAWLKNFKSEIRTFSGDARVYRYRGRIVATDDPNGKFSIKELESIDPDLVREYTRLVVEEKFDEAAFRKDHPKLWERCRAQSFRLK